MLGEAVVEVKNGWRIGREGVDKTKLMGKGEERGKEVVGRMDPVAVVHTRTYSLFLEAPRPYLLLGHEPAKELMQAQGHPKEHVQR